MFLIRLSLIVGLSFACGARAADYPDKPIRIVIPYAPGGTTDAVARIVGNGVWALWNQPVINDNHGGAAGNIGAEMVARAAPDGYTLLLSAAGPLAINKSLYKSLSYDPDAFAPVSVVASSHSVLVMNPRSGIDGLPALIGYAKAHPGKLSYASAGYGSTPQLAAELLKSMSGIQIVQVPYRGVAPALTDLIAGQVDMMFVELGAAMPYIQAGKLRAIAVGSERRKSALPDVPTLAETLPGFLSVTWFGLAAPPGTPPSIVERLSGAVDAVLRQPDSARQIQALNIDAVGGTPAQAAAFMKREGERWGRVLSQAGAQMPE